MLASFRDSIAPPPPAASSSAWTSPTPAQLAKTEEAPKTSPEPPVEVAGLQLSQVEDAPRADVIAIERADSLEGGKDLASSHAFAMTLGHLDDIRWRVTAMARRPSTPFPPSEADAIRQVVRDNHGLFQLCYEAALRIDPLLHGRILVKFAIAPSGSVLFAADGGSDLPSPEVVECVVRAFSGLAFAANDTPVIHVVYPLVFSPDGEPR